MLVRRFIGSIIGLLTAVLALALSARADPAKPGYQVVCNPGNPSETVDRRFVQDAFLKKVRTWPSGASALPVDLPPSSPVRRRFTEDLLKRSVEAVRIFWQQRIFAGRDLPPPELAGDEEVIRFVLRDKGAIGYVSNNAALKGAKVLLVK